MRALTDNDRHALRRAAPEINQVLGPSLQRLAADSEPAARISAIAGYVERLFRLHRVSRDGARDLADLIRSALEQGSNGSVAAVLAALAERGQGQR